MLTLWLELVYVHRSAIAADVSQAGSDLTAVGNSLLAADSARAVSEKVKITAIINERTLLLALSMIAEQKVHPVSCASCL